MAATTAGLLARCRRLPPAFYAQFAALCVLFFLSSGGLTLYNKWIISVYGFNFPVWLVTITYSVAAALCICTRLLSGLPLGCCHTRAPCGRWLRRAGVHPFSDDRWTLRKVGAVVCVGAMAATEVASSNVSLLYLDVSYHIMLRAAIPVFVLLWAFMLRLERPSLRLVVVVIFICGGVVVLTYGENMATAAEGGGGSGGGGGSSAVDDNATAAAAPRAFSWTGTAYVLLSCFCAGCKWAVSELTLASGRRRSDTKGHRDGGRSHGGRGSSTQDQQQLQPCEGGGDAEVVLRPARCCGCCGYARLVPSASVRRLPSPHRPVRVSKATIQISLDPDDEDARAERSTDPPGADGQWQPATAEAEGGCGDDVGAGGIDVTAPAAVGDTAAEEGDGDVAEGRDATCDGAAATTPDRVGHNTAPAAARQNAASSDDSSSLAAAEAAAQPMTSFSLLSTTALVSALTLLPVDFLSDEFEGLRNFTDEAIRRANASDPSSQAPAVHFVEVALVLVGCAMLSVVLTLVTFLFIKLTSGLTLSIVNIAKQLLVIAVSIAIYGDSVTWVTLVGFGLCVVGLAWFNYVKFSSAQATAA